MKLRVPMLPGVVGIFVGGCVNRGEGSSFRASAHAHNYCGPNQGWICIRGRKRLPPYVLNDSADGFDGELTATNRLIMHEYAHILCPNHGHDETWRKKMRELKQPIRARYKANRIRKPCSCGKHHYGTPASTWYATDNMCHSWARCHS